MTEDGRQMSDDWIKERIAEAVGDDADLIEDIQVYGYEKWLLRYNPDTDKITKKMLD
jgi:hypothetical protein